jgi:carbonic anhydrase/acetyltransferase-like protein (isoleucine patch superfamily)
MPADRSMSPRIDPRAWIAPGATVVGEVEIARDASIWFHATVRGDVAPIVIGEGSNIQDSCVVHADHGLPTNIGASVTVGHGAVVHGSIIGDHVLVAMGSVVLSGCRVGGESMIGAGTVLPEGTEVPPGSLVLGVPGRVVRALRPDEIERVRENARTYRDLARSYREGVVPIPGTEA